MIICWRKPSLEKQEQCLKKAERHPFSYPEVGASRTLESEEIAYRYHIDRYHCILGKGEDIYDVAKEGLLNWVHFDLGWVRIDAPIPVEGMTVPVCIRVCGVWTLHFCRIVYFQENDGAIKKWGFAYGTLQSHAEQGEELFMLEYDTITEEVSYHIAAFSRPRHILSKLGYPLTRFLQKRFGAQSLRRMQQWIAIKSL